MISYYGVHHSYTNEGVRLVSAHKILLWISWPQCRENRAPFKFIGSEIWEVTLFVKMRQFQSKFWRPLPPKFTWTAAYNPLPSYIQNSRVPHRPDKRTLTCPDSWLNRSDSRYIKNWQSWTLMSKHLNADSMSTSKLSQKPSTGFTLTGQVPLTLFHIST